MKKFLLSLAMPAIVVGSLALAWHQVRMPRPIPVGVVAWLASGAVVGSSEMNASDLFLEENPRSRIQVLPVDDQWQPEKTVPAIQDAMAKGVRFFVSTHPSKCGVASMHLFADSRALMINTASASPALTGKDDFILRIAADTEQEQHAIADHVHRLPGHRILVLQDTGNLPYTDPAFKTFSTELAEFGGWDIVNQRLAVSAFKPDELQPLMAAQYDALYILAGSYQAAIGNIAQQFHHLHPATPILLTPWTRSPAILENAGPAIDWIILPSQYPSRRDDSLLDHYFRRLHSRFGYEPHAMTIGVRQALELLDQAFAKGYDNPAQVKGYLLSVPTHQTSLGPISFDRYGDVSRQFYFLTDLNQELE